MQTLEKEFTVKRLVFLNGSVEHIRESSTLCGNDGKLDIGKVNDYLKHVERVKIEYERKVHVSRYQIAGTTRTDWRETLYELESDDNEVLLLQFKSGSGGEIMYAESLLNEDNQYFDDEKVNRLETEMDVSYESVDIVFTDSILSI